MRKLLIALLAALPLAVLAATPKTVTLTVILESVLTCPYCGHSWQKTMPTDACQFYDECPACHALLRPKPGDCCVFCSFGSVPCPPIQQQRGCCERPAS